MTESKGNATQDNLSMASSEEILFFRLSSAIEAIVFYVVIFNICPVLYRERKRSTFYERFSILFLLILLIVLIRFYDFLEDSLFRSMTKEQKLRFVIYIISTVDAMYEHSLVALDVEILLELSLVLYQELKLWILFIGLAGGLPITFLFLYIIVWETSKTFSSVFTLAICEGVIPALGVLILCPLIYITACRKKAVLSEDCLTRVKAITLINFVSFLGICLNLLLFLVNASIVMGDLVDALIKLVVCVSYLMAQPNHWAARLLLPSLNQETVEESVLSQEVM